MNFINHFYIILTETLKKQIIIPNLVSDFKTGYHTQQGIKKCIFHIINIFMKVEKSCHAAVPMVVHFVVASRVSYAGALLPIDEVI